MQPKPTPQKQLTSQDGRILCVDCRDYLTGQDPCGSWWNGKRHTCASFTPKIPQNKGAEK